MMPRITVEVGGGLRKEAWIYWFNDSARKLELDNYQVQERPSKRHNWRAIQMYDRLSRRFTRDDIKQLKREEVPITDEVRAAVFQKFVEMIEVE